MRSKLLYEGAQRGYQALQQRYEQQRKDASITRGTPFHEFADGKVLITSQKLEESTRGAEASTNDRKVMLEALRDLGENRLQPVTTFDEKGDNQISLIIPKG
jgi:hypothetical protein